MITISPTAGSHVKEMAKQEKFPEGTALRLGVTTEGCDSHATKFRYTVGFDSKPAAAADEVFESEGVKVYVDRESLPHLDGLQLDIQETFAGVEFMFRNPNASHSCGCGHTFSEEPPE